MTTLIRLGATKRYWQDTAELNQLQTACQSKLLKQ